jgi:hypothetical protein
MEPLMSMKTASVLLALTAVGGIVMAIMRLRKRNPPAWLAMVHGFVAASAVTILAYAWFTVGLPGMASIALLLFVLAALGGVVMNLNYHWKALPLPVGLMFGHAGLAVVGFVLLLMATFAGK